MYRFLELFIIITLIAGPLMKTAFAQNNNLLAYYPFNGNANDESGNGNHGSVMGATLVEDRFGNPDNAYSFDGVDDHIAFPILYSVSPDSLSIVAWFSYNTVQSDGKILYHGDNGEIQLFVGGDTTWAGVHLGQSVSDPWYYVREFSPQNEWQMMVALWIQGESFRLYLNGNLVDSVSVSMDALLDPGPSYPPSIGSYGRTRGGFFNGKIDDIRIYSRVLSINEIDSLFSEGITSIEEKALAIPDNFELLQNYPNPFNPTTKIKYQIPDGGLVSLQVYNLLGEVVTTLVNAEQPIGHYEVEFDATSLPNGIYFYKLQAGSFADSKKMILLK